jgi:hypothetical protein
MNDQSDKQREEAVAARVAHLESWVEVFMRNLAGLGLETVLCELDEARGLI